MPDLPPPPAGYSIQDLPPPPSGYKLDSDAGQSDTQPPKSRVDEFFHGVGDTLTGLWKTATGDSEREQQLHDDVKQGKYGHAALNLLQTSLGPGYDLFVKPAIDQAIKAKDTFKAGRYSEAAGHAAAAVVPGGAFAANLADTAMGEPEMPPGQQVEPPHEGEPYRAAGQAVTAATIAALAKTNAAGKAVNAVSHAFDADPDVALVKALKPTPSDSGFTDRLADARANIKAAAGNKPITGTEDLIDAAKAGIAAHKDALGQWMMRARQMNTQVSGDPVVEATKEALPDTLLLEDPKAADRIINQVDSAYGGKTFSVDKLRTLLKEKNAELDSFYDKATGKQQASVTSGSPQSVVKAQRDVIAKELYKALDPENDGAGPRQIQQQMGDMIDLLDAANKRRNASIAEKPVSAADKYGKVAAAIADIPGKALHGEIEKGLSGVHEAMGGTTDPLIKRAFSATGDAKPLPLPPPRIYANQKALGGGPVITPPPEDTSGPIPVTPRPGAGMGQSTGERLLPGATPGQPEPIITEPPPGSYPGQGPSGPIPHATPVTENTSHMLPAAEGSPVKQPGFAVQDMVAVHDPKTGEITYHSQADLRDAANISKLPKDAKMYKAGDTVHLKGIGAVKITKVNPDGTFEY